MRHDLQRSEQLTCVAEHAGQPRNIFQARFSKKDGSLFVAFPYYANATGVASFHLRPTMMLFVGGFDPVALMDDLSKDVSFLALSYPAGDHGKLAARLEHRPTGSR